jgi:hypothetical protein
MEKAATVEARVKRDAPFRPSRFDILEPRGKGRGADRAGRTSAGTGRYRDGRIHLIIFSFDKMPG